MCLLGRGLGLSFVIVLLDSVQYGMLRDLYFEYIAALDEKRKITLVELMTGEYFPHVS